jgi:hypothetical protein
MDDIVGGAILEYARQVVLVDRVPATMDDGLVL